jgi:hypothetical protein
MASMQKRIAFGFVAGVISVLVFHQGVWALLHYLDLPSLGMPPPYPVDKLPPFGAPRLLSLCFFGGLWGALFGALWRGARGTFWYGGLCVGIAAMLVGFFVVAPLKGLPIGGGFMWNNWVRSALINGIWGLGVGLMLPRLLGLSAPPDEYANR